MLNAFIDFALRELGRAELAAWLILYRHAKPDGIVTASVADLARRAGCTPRTMQTALKRLRSRQLLRRLKRGTLAGGPSIWRLATPEPDGTTGRILPVTTGREVPV
ncbi:MAG: helix-turn-helix domain-containing protein [Planctomycetes bacterium]|nr:helix-turn-helix domain-containing protein [Planctomycetota bacterium]